MPPIKASKSLAEIPELPEPPKPAETAPDKIFEKKEPVIEPPIVENTIIDPPEPPKVEIDEPEADNIGIDIKPKSKAKSEKQLAHLQRIREKSLIARRKKKEEKELAKAQKTLEKNKVVFDTPVGIAPTPVAPPKNSYSGMSDLDITNIIDQQVNKRFAARDAKKAEEREAHSVKRAEEINKKKAEIAVLEKKKKQNDLARRLLRPGKRR